MTKEYPITQRQTAILSAAQDARDSAVRELQIVVETILAGLDVLGTVVSVDTEKHVLTVEVPEPAA